MVNGKSKGSEFERSVCKALSLWITVGKSVDVFWRSAMSGGRATVAKGAVRQAGDITAVAPEGHILTDQFYLELKHLKKIDLDGLIKDNGPLLAIWKKTQEEAAKYHRIPTLIFKQNHWPVVLCTTNAGIDKLKSAHLVCVESASYDMCFIRFDDLLKTTFPLN